MGVHSRGRTACGVNMRRGGGAAGGRAESGVGCGCGGRAQATRERQHWEEGATGDQGGPMHEADAGGGRGVVDGMATGRGGGKRAAAISRGDGRGGVREKSGLRIWAVAGRKKHGPGYWAVIFIGPRIIIW
ncbi:hypothetical protein E2562_007073 [Oryza meyeriana var. granulata]|uniref:DUF834 domain-containing protein n=1 Tax=Oryza meyeriana var. granulata TaxID=110450 RepID=A0A6G1F4T3_9ORYZ|nr:hypothetical protein E2562_007073 [Oryza meyeriana var. granulata]